MGTGDGARRGVDTAAARRVTRPFAGSGPVVGVAAAVGCAVLPWLMAQRQSCWPHAAFALPVLQQRQWADATIGHFMGHDGAANDAAGIANQSANRAARMRRGKGTGLEADHAHGVGGLQGDSGAGAPVFAGRGWTPGLSRSSPPAITAPSD